MDDLPRRGDILFLEREPSRFEQVEVLDVEHKSFVVYVRLKIGKNPSGLHKWSDIKDKLTRRIIPNG